ncbi:hypothetical protein CAPTEDRAFT_229214 [Capitella teleta]|uniref:Uncharacterized protein n=1 Tax=Capitella teleta TaxID=283909 RepID=R7TH76_CAPTE|nr:hypothetical protein CAPTEDRAFT_229214 [Capitella teleta]|eukprot:ELT93064.1 hypothetical protein CAPTEDRAFT_229214 [Capitella teleta]
MKKSSGMLTVAVIMVAMALGLVAIGLATENWLVTVVDRKALAPLVTSSALEVFDTSPYYYSRNRGLIRTCFPGSDLEFLDAFPNVVDGWCLYETGYEIPPNEDTIKFGSFYVYRYHLMRTQFALICISLLLLLISSLAVGSGCLKNDGSNTRIGAVLAAIGGFFVAVAMAIFHGIEYIENEKITTAGTGFPASYPTDAKYTLLDSYSRSSYGYSYFLSWIGALAAFIAALIGLCTSYDMSVQHGDKAEDDGLPLGSPPMAYGLQDAGYLGQDAGYPGMDAGYPDMDAGYPGQEAGYPGFTNYGYDAYNTYGRY